MFEKTAERSDLKELYREDFYLWVMENLRLLKEKHYDQVDWENLLEEIEDMAKSELRSVISYMAIILEHLYKWENFRATPEMGKSWIKSINNARKEMEKLFEFSPSLRKRSQEESELAWRIAVKELVYWFSDPDNRVWAEKFFGRLPTKKDFPEKCPYTFEQVFEYKPWILEGE
ncbi:DUF29 domain-containing protein [Thermocrinis sp.]